MSTDRLTALVMCAGSMPGVAVINALKRQDELPIRVVAADASPLAAGFHLADASAMVPYANTDAFLPTVLDICRREGVGLVFPIIDEELLVFAERRPVRRRGDSGHHRMTRTSSPRCATSTGRMSSADARGSRSPRPTCPATCPTTRPSR